MNSADRKNQEWLGSDASLDSENDETKGLGFTYRNTVIVVFIILGAVATIVAVAVSKM